MNYVEREKEYRKMANEAGNLIIAYNRQRKKVDTLQAAIVLELKILNMRRLRDDCLIKAQALSEYKNSEAEQGEE